MIPISNFKSISTLMLMNCFIKPRILYFPHHADLQQSRKIVENQERNQAVPTRLRSSICNWRGPIYPREINPQGGLEINRRRFTF